MGSSGSKNTEVKFIPPAPPREILQVQPKKIKSKPKAVSKKKKKDYEKPAITKGYGQEVDSSVSSSGSNSGSSDSESEEYDKKKNKLQNNQPKPRFIKPVVAK